MKWFGGVTGVAVLAGFGLLLVGCGSQDGGGKAVDPVRGPVSTVTSTRSGGTQSEPSSTPPAVKPARATAPVTYLVRNFERMNNGRYITHARVPNGWREVRIGEHDTRFLDTASDRTMRFETWPGPHAPAELVAAKVKELQAAVPSLHGLESATVTMKSQAGQSPMTVGQVTYTYTVDKSQRRVITYFVALKGHKYADAVLTVSGQPNDGAVLRDIIDNATKTLTITPLG